MQNYELTVLNTWNTQNLVIEILKSTNHHRVFQHDAIRPVIMIFVKHTNIICDNLTNIPS